MITDLVIDHYRLDDGMANSLQDLFGACGRGLQKTNIVKDFEAYLARGVCYIPGEWMQECIQGAKYLATSNDAIMKYRENIEEQFAKMFPDSRMNCVGIIAEFG